MSDFNTNAVISTRNLTGYQDLMKMSTPHVSNTTSFVQKNLVELSDVGSIFTSRFF